MCAVAVVFAVVFIRMDLHLCAMVALGHRNELLLIMKSALGDLRILRFLSMQLYLGSNQLVLVLHESLEHEYLITDGISVILGSIGL